LARDYRSALEGYDFAALPGETVLKGVSTDNHFFAVRAWARMALARLPYPRKSSGGRRRNLHRPNSDPLSNEKVPHKENGWQQMRPAVPVFC